MIVSDARREANRRNAQLSTGPRTPEGKERSRANALKHGLCSSVVVAEDAAAVQERAQAFYHTLRPQNEFHVWLVDEIAVISLRIDRCERIERRARDQVALRAELTWEDDRMKEAEALGSEIARRPSEVARALRETPQGCEWMISRWAMLAHSADTRGCWTPEQTRLAFDLLGTPAEFREGHRPGTSLDLDGRVIESAEDPASVARCEIAALEERRERVSDLDEVRRSLASSDLTDQADLESRRLRRYESSLHRRLRWCLDQLKYESPHRTPNPDLKPRWAAEPRTEAVLPAAPEPSGQPPKVREFWEVDPPNPPFDLTPEEVPGPGEVIDLAEIVAARREKSARRAETRRDRRRRRLERLRA